jgi:threonine/homoserine/homoserine lactone efflux protein
MVISFCCLLGYAYLSASARNRASHRGLSGRYSKLFGLMFIISGGLLAGSSPRQV